MIEIPIGMAASEEVVLTALTRLKNGKIDDAIARFAEEFRFKDHGIGLEFTDKERLAEFFQKTRELYPGSFLQTDSIFVSGDHVITEWTFQATLTKPFYGGLSRKVRVSFHGTSIVRTDNGKITDWADRIRNARANGKKLGRPKRGVDRERILELKEQGQSLREIAASLGVGYP